MMIYLENNRSNCEESHCFSAYHSRVSIMIKITRNFTSSKVSLVHNEGSCLMIINRDALNGCVYSYFHISTCEQNDKAPKKKEDVLKHF